MDMNMFPVIDNRERLEELTGRQATTSIWTAVVVDRQGDVFGTYLGNGTWTELGSAVPFCLSGRIALPARLVAGEAFEHPSDRVTNVVQHHSLQWARLGNRAPLTTLSTEQRHGSENTHHAHNNCDENLHAGVVGSVRPTRSGWMRRRTARAYGQRYKQR